VYTAPATQKGSAEAEVRTLCVTCVLQKALCTAPATHKGGAEALWSAPARQKAA
jgi:hypothetical protein